jgi:hypothetical protein
VGAILLMCLVIERQVTQTHAGRIEFLGDVVVQWAIKAVEILLSEPLGQVIFVLLSSAIAFFTRDTWYVTIIHFPPEVTQLTCAAQDLIDGPIRTLFEFLNDPEWKDLLFLIEVYLSRIRIKLTQIIYETYPFLQAGCEGASVSVVPIHTYLTIPFFAMTWLAALLLVLQVFPEAQRVTDKAGFWIIAFAATFSSFLVVQLLGDLYISFFYLLVEGTIFERVYTNTGYWASCAQILQMVVCLAMYHHKVNDEKARKELIGKGTSRGSLSKGQSILDRIASPLWLFVGLGITLLVLGFYSSVPVDNVSVIKITPNGPPAWLHNTSNSLDVLAAESFALMFSKSLVKVAAIVKGVAWLCNKVSFDIPGIDINFNLNEVAGGIKFVEKKMEEGMVIAAKEISKGLEVVLNEFNVSISPLTEALDALPSLENLNTLSILPIPSLDLPSLKSTSWVSICVVSVAVLFIIVEIAAVFLGTEFQALSDALKAMLVSAFGAAVVFIVSLYYQMYLWNLSVVIDWNPNVYIYVLSIVMFSVGIIFGFIGSDEEEQERLELQPGLGVSGGRGGALYGKVSTDESVEKGDSGETKPLKPADYPLALSYNRR